MPTPTPLHLPRSVRDAVIAHARAELPNECCGLLAGVVEAGVVKCTGTGRPATFFTSPLVGEVGERAEGERDGWGVVVTPDSPESNPPPAACGRDLPHKGGGEEAPEGEASPSCRIARVSHHFPVRNDLASPTEYASNPRDMLDALKAARAAGTEVLAIYHSHPASDPVQSRTDIERNYWGEGVIHVIIGLAGSEPDVRAWRLGGTGYQEITFTIEG